MEVRGVQCVVDGVRWMVDGGGGWWTRDGGKWMVDWWR